MAQEHRSTQRVLDIFELLAFGERSTGYTLTEIATELQVPKSSIFPIIHTLAANRYLRYNSDTARYRIGRRAFEIGNTYVKMIFSIRRPSRSCRTLSITAPKLVTSASFRGGTSSI